MSRIASMSAVMPSFVAAFVVKWYHVSAREGAGGFSKSCLSASISAPTANAETSITAEIAQTRMLLEIKLNITIIDIDLY